MTKKPWELNNRLKEQHINIVAAIILKARDNCANRFERDSGDDNWTNGVRSYRWCTKAIKDAAEEYEFLQVIEDVGLAFTFSLDGVPARLTRDDIDKPSSKLFVSRPVEVKQYELFKHNGEDAPADVLWKYVVETIGIEVSRISFVGLNSKTSEIECSYEISLDENVRILSDLSAKQEDAVDVGEIKISYREEEQKKKEGLNA